MPDDAPAWRQIDRRRFHDSWDALPSLTVLAALPGWGRTDWMRECRDRLVVAGVPTTWLAGQDAAQSLREPEGLDGVVFVDDAVDGRHDPLWASIASAAAAGTRVVVSTIDTPPAALLAGIDSRVLHEDDLRFTAEEIAALIEANAVALGTDTRDDLSVRLRGCPSLVRRQLERLRVRRDERVWASLAFSFESTLVRGFAGAEDVGDSTFVRMLRRGSAFRRFSTSLLDTGDARAAADDAAQFDRLEALPLGTFDICDETGQQDFVWSAAAWSTFDDVAPPADRRRALEHALARIAESGRVTAQLLALLELGRLDEADALVFDQHRRFLLFTDGATQERLLADAGATARHPSLLLLSAELRLRAHGANHQTIRDAELALDAFAPSASATAFERFRLHCRRAIAAAYAGRRATSVSHLEAVFDMLDAALGSRVRTAAAESRDVAARVAADLFLAFWAAIQTDRHELALGFVRVMQELGDPADRVTQIDRLTAITEEDFAGLRSLSRAGERPDQLEFSHAAPLVLIEEGDDHEALERTHPLASRARPAPTRSAPDALLVLSRALVAPDRLERGQVDATVARSAAFWDDGRPSTFIAFAAAVAHLAVGRVDEARELSTDHPQQDFFTRTAAALVALADARPADALRLLEGHEETGIPRFDVLTGVLTAAALARSGLRGAAAARLDAVWLAQPAPRLHRFALRFLDASTFEMLAAVVADDDRPEGAAGVLRESAGDRRPPSASRAAPLSPVEREILTLQRRGLGNAAIASARGVSHNTIRTQIRLLYRKLGVADRAEALAVAERLALLDDAMP